MSNCEEPEIFYNNVFPNRLLDSNKDGRDSQHLMSEEKSQTLAGEDEASERRRGRIKQSLCERVS